MSIHQQDFNLVTEDLRFDYLPAEILNKPPIVWLGSDSNYTIPVFAHDLRNKITFIDTAIDCTEHITALSVPQRSIVLIMSDEYSIHRKEIEDMLSLDKIKMIYVIVDESLSNLTAYSLRNRRLRYIFNDTLSVLKRLCHDKDQRSTHLDMSMSSNKQTTEISGDSITTDTNEESVRIKQSSPHHSAEKPAPDTQIDMPEKVEQPSLSWKALPYTPEDHTRTRTSNEVTVSQENQGASMRTNGNYCIQEANRYAEQAVGEDKSYNYEAALQHYMTAADWLMQAIQYGTMNASMKQVIRSKINGYFKRAEEIKNALRSESIKRKRIDDSVNNRSKWADNSSDGIAESDRRRLMQEFEKMTATTSKVSFDDIVGLVQAKNILKTAIVMPIKVPQFFLEKRKPWRRILLYGPPGTGKSYLAEATATECKSTLIAINPNDLLSKWGRESKKRVQILFELARERQPCILFIDHIETLSSQPNDTESELLCVKNEFLAQIEDTRNDKSNVLILAATHLPWTLDAAIRQGFEKRIYIPLPGAQERVSMFKMHLGIDNVHTIEEYQWIQFAQRTECYSGADIAVVSRAALMNSIRRIGLTTHFKEILNPKLDGRRRLWIPCSSDDPQAIPLTLDEIKSDDLCEPPITLSDVVTAITTQKSTVTESDLLLYQQFIQKFGQEGSQIYLTEEASANDTI